MMMWGWVRQSVLVPQYSTPFTQICSKTVIHAPNSETFHVFRRSPFCRVLTQPFRFRSPDGSVSEEGMSLGIGTFVPLST